MTTMAIVQHDGVIHGSSVPGSLTLYSNGFIAWSGDDTGDSATLNAGATSFNMSAPSGFSAWDSSGSCTWDPSNKGSAVTLSSGNMLATSSAGGSWSNSSVCSTTGHTNGQRYFEITATAMTGYCSYGLASANATMSGYQYIGSDANSFGFISDGDVYTVSGYSSPLR